MSSMKSSSPDANLQLLKTKDQGRKGKEDNALAFICFRSSVSMESVVRQG